jgi:hypothetical protein
MGARDWKGVWVHMLKITLGDDRISGVEGDSVEIFRLMMELGAGGIQWKDVENAIQGFSEFEPLAKACGAMGYTCRERSDDEIVLVLPQTQATIGLKKARIYFRDWQACEPLMDILDPNQEVLVCDSTFGLTTERTYRAGELKGIFID